MENSLKLLRLLVGGVSAAVTLTACSQGATQPPTITTVNPIAPSYGTLEFSVGTANIFGTATGLNIVSSFRQVAGGTPAKSAVLVSTPSITGPLTLPAASADSGAGYDPFATTNIPNAANAVTGGGPSAQEVAKGATISGTPSTVRFDEYVCDQVAACSSSTPANTTSLGLSGGVFSMGLQPSNSTNNGVPYTYVPYTQPIWDSSANTFIAWGGPPAYDVDGHGMGVRDGLNNLGSNVLGVNEGVTVFEGVKIASGTYTLSLGVPTGVSSSGTSTIGTLTQTAALKSTATLPTLTAPVLTPDGVGGGTFPVTLPASVTEEFVQVTDSGIVNASGSPGTTCQGALGTQAGLPVYYTLVVKASGTVTLPASDGPNTSSGSSSVFTPSPSICTAAQNTSANGGTATPADTYSVQVIGTDYDLYGASPVFGSAAPALTGASGQSDITISLPVSYVYGSAVPVAGHVRARHAQSARWSNPRSAFRPKV